MTVPPPGTPARPAPAASPASSNPARAIGAREDLLPRWAGWLLGALVLVLAYPLEAPDLTDPRALAVIAAWVAAAALSTWVTPAAVVVALLGALGTAAWPTAGVGVGYLVVVWLPFVVGARYGAARAAAFVAAMLVIEWAGFVLGGLWAGGSLVGVMLVEALGLGGSALGGAYAGRVWHRGSSVEADLRESNDAFRRALSRDLHDTAVHATTTMVMRANQVLLREDLDPQVRRDVQFIVDTGREATATLRATLASLREADPATGDVSADATWFRAQVAGSVARLEEAGFRVRAATEASLVDVSPVVLSTLGRIITEITNNVIRHGAPDSEVSLMVEHTGETLDLMCSNPLGPEHAGDVPTGPGGAGAAGGAVGAAPDGAQRRSWGLIGVRELAEAVGGTGSFRALGGYWVAQVSLPLNGSNDKH